SFLSCSASICVLSPSSLAFSLLYLRTSFFSPFFFFNAPAPPEIYTLSLHDALPICPRFFLYGGSAGRLDNCLPPPAAASRRNMRSEEHTSELQSRFDLVCRLLLEKKKKHAIQQKEQRIHTGTGDDKTE